MIQNRTPNPEGVLENRTRLPENHRFSGALRLIRESVFENSTRPSTPVLEFQSGTIKSRSLCRVIWVWCSIIEHVTETCCEISYTQNYSHSGHAVEFTYIPNSLADRLHRPTGRASRSHSPVRPQNSPEWLSGRGKR